MHGSNFDNRSVLFALEDAVSTSPRHARNIEQLGPIYHVVVLPAGNANSICFNLEAKATLVFPQRCCNSRFYTRRRDLACGVKVI